MEYPGCYDAMKLGFFIYTGWTVGSIIYGIIGGGIKFWIARHSSLTIQAGSTQSEDK